MPLPLLSPVAAEDLEVGRSVAAVARLRGRVLEALEAAEEGRVALHGAFLQAQPAALAEAGGYSDADFLYMAWLHAGLRCLDEVGRVWAADGRVPGCSHALPGRAGWGGEGRVWSGRAALLGWAWLGRGVGAFWESRCGGGDAPGGGWLAVLLAKVLAKVLGCDGHVRRPSSRCPTWLPWSVPDPAAAPACWPRRCC